MLSFAGSRNFFITNFLDLLLVQCYKDTTIQALSAQNLSWLLTMQNKQGGKTDRKKQPETKKM